MKTKVTNPSNAPDQKRGAALAEASTSAPVFCIWMLDVIHCKTSILGVQVIEWLPGFQPDRMGARCQWSLIDASQVSHV
jgi:hypothetical protein